MKTQLESALIAAVSLATVFGAGSAHAAHASSAPAAGAEPGPGLEAVMLHEWPDTVSLGFNAAGRLILYMRERQAFEIHDLALTNAAVTGWTLPPDIGKVFGGALSADRRTLATLAQVATNQSQIQLWNVETGERTEPGFAPTDVAQLAFSPDDELLAGVVALDGTVRVWDRATGKLRWSQALPSPMQVTWIGIQFSPDGRFLAARNSYALQVWDVAKRRVTGSDDLYSYLAISPDWKLAQGFSLKPRAQQPPRVGLLDITDPDRPAPVRQLPEDAGGENDGCAFAAGGRLLTLNSSNQRLKLWDTAKGRVIREAPIAAGRTIPLALSPDARVLASIEFEPVKRNALRGDLRLWEVATGKSLAPARPLPGTFWDWQFDPDSRYLVVSCAQGNDTFGVQIWRLPENGAPIVEVRQSMDPAESTVEVRVAGSPQTTLRP